jgi:hypothetical protein
MKLQGMLRVPLGAAVALPVLALAGCDGNPLMSPANPIVQGIVEWVDLPSDGLGGTGWEGDVARARVELPDTIRAGESFTVRVVTLRPSQCWFSDSVGIRSEAGRIELIKWVRGPRPGQVCPLAMSELSRQVALSFDEPGDHEIVLVGRRVSGSAPAHDAFTGEESRLEISVTVHPPASP